MIRTVSVGRDPGYDVLIGPRLMDRAGETLAPYAPNGRVVVFAAPTVAEHHGERLTAAIEAAPLRAELVVGDGAPLSPPGAGDLVLSFGGGAMAARTSDLTAAVARGARLVRAPTTLVAQVECVTGLDPRPCVVLADLDVLATLPPEQVRAGYALVLKHALAADARLFGWLEAHGRSVIELEAPALAHAVAGCVEARVRSPRDQLTLGEAFTDALRADDPSLAYGDAVGLGCALAFQFAAVLGVCAEDDHAERATWNLAAVGLPVRLEEAPVAPFSARALTARMRRACEGPLALALPRRIGEAEVVGVDPAALEDFLIAEGALP